METKYHLKSVDVSYVYVEARSGANIFDCKRDAALLALSEDREVHLVHNNTLYIVLPKIILASYDREIE